MMPIMFRDKNKIQNPYTIQDYYKDYKQSVGKDNIYCIDYSLYCLILTMYYKGMVDVILETGKAFKMPCNLGTLKIVKKKMNYGANMYTSSIDWENSKKYQKIIHHINEHSDGYKYLFMWDKKGANTKNITKYRFIPTRDNKRRLASYIKNKVRDYFEL